MSLPFATSLQRSVAAILNLVIGTLPLSIPNILYDYPGALHLLRERLFLTILSLVLVILQVLFVYYMQGSPGAVFLGLRIEGVNGSRPGIGVVSIRAVPFLVAYVLYRLINWASGDMMLVGLLGLLLAVPLLFMLISAVVLLVDRERSLLDKLSKTRVVKAYAINPRNDLVA